MQHRREALQAAAVRCWRPVSLAVLAAALAVMAVMAHDEPSFGWDRALADWLLGLSTPAYDAFMEVVSVPGNYWNIVIMMLAGAVLATWWLGWRAGLLVFAGLGLMGVNEVFKDIVDRPRPLDPVTGGGESFPSGHTLHAVLMSGLAWLLVAPRLLRPAHRCALLALAVLWPALVGISRVHLEVHWPSDVLGAYVFGAMLLIVLSWVWPRVQPAASARPDAVLRSTKGPVEGPSSPLSDATHEGAP